VQDNKLPARLAAFALALGLAGAADAQTPSAAIAGEAKPGDIAVIRNVDSGFTREVKVKDNGRYALRNLPTGTYMVTIRHPDGGVEQPRTAVLRVGSTSRVQ
jgi:hypothetical protein